MTTYETGALTVAYRLHPCWYDHEFTGLEYEVVAFLKAIQSVGGKIYSVSAEDAYRCPNTDCRHTKYTKRDVTSKYLPVAQ